MNRNDPFKPYIDPHLLRSIEQAQNLLRDHAYHLRFHVPEIEGFLQNWRAFNVSNLEVLRDGMKHITNFGVQIPSSFSNFSRDLKQLSHLSAAIDPQLIRQFRTSLSNIGPLNARYLLAFSEVTSYLRENKAFLANANTFGYEVFEAISQLEDDDIGTNEEEFLSHIARILDLVFEQAKRLKPDSVSAKGVLNVLFTLSLFFYSLNDNRATEQRLADLINHRSDEIVRLVTPPKSEPAVGIFAVIERPVRLMIKPKSGSPTIQILTRNQVVRILKPGGRWIYVEYFDYVEGLPKNGWVMKKYSKRIESGPTQVEE